MNEMVFIFGVGSTERIVLDKLGNFLGASNLPHPTLVGGKNAFRNKIKMLRITGDTFEMPRDFDFEKFIRHSFKVMQDELYTVVIQISPAWAPYVRERIWHESQTIQKLFDGGIELTFRVAGLDEVKQWVLSMGPEAYVIEPEELKALVRHSLKSTLTRYEPAQNLYKDSPVAPKYKKSV